MDNKLRDAGVEKKIEKQSSPQERNSYKEKRNQLEMRLVRRHETSRDGNHTISCLMKSTFFYLRCMVSSESIAGMWLES